MLHFCLFFSFFSSLFFIVSFSCLELLKCVNLRPAFNAFNKNNKNKKIIQQNNTHINGKRKQTNKRKTTKTTSNH